MRTEKKGIQWGQLLRRNAVVAAVGLFVCAAVYLNWDYEQQTQAGKTLGQSTLVSNQTEDPLLGDGTQALSPEQTVGEEQNKGSGYFASARLNRQQARDSALSLLQDAASQEDADETIRLQMNDTIQTMADYTITEAQIENLVTAKGYGDCICFINDNSVSVVVSSTENGLNESDIAKIVEIVQQETGLAAEQIKIIETEP
jgi:stage III sporulation protein AH